MNRFGFIPVSASTTPADNWRVHVKNRVAAMVEAITRASPNPVRVDAVRSKMLAATRKALSDSPDDPMLQPVFEAFETMMEIPTQEMLAVGEDAVPGMLRLALMDKYPNWQDAIGAETIMSFVQERTEVEIDDYWISSVKGLVARMYDLIRQPAPLAGASTHRLRVFEEIDAALDPTLLGGEKNPRLWDNDRRSFKPAGVMRAIIGALGLQYSDPLVAITVRAAADETLAELVANATAESAEKSIKLNPKSGRPWTWQNRLTLATSMLVEIERSDPSIDDESIRRNVLGFFEGAFEPLGDDEVREADVPREDGQPGTTREAVTSPPNVFRIALWNEDIDWSDPENKSHARGLVEDAIRDALIGRIDYQRG